MLMAPSIRPAVPRRQLGAELRRLREDAGFLIEYTAKPLESHAVFEADAIRRWEFQASTMPGLLQTADNARAILKIFPWNSGPQDIDDLVELRIREQEDLYRDDIPLRLNCIDEPVLSRSVGAKTGYGRTAAQKETAVEVRTRRATVAKGVMAVGGLTAVTFGHGTLMYAIGAVCVILALLLAVVLLCRSDEPSKRLERLLRTVVKLR
jgi:hypothetical protein